MNTKHEPDSGRPRDLFRHYVGDVVYGANDGLVTTFTVVCGVAGAGLSATVLIILGCVNLVADGFSMGASNYLSIRSRPGSEGVDRGRAEPFLHAVATFLSFVIVGAVPLVSYLFPVGHAFLLSAIFTGVTLFAVGSSRSLVVDQRWVKCGLEMFAIGSLAAGVAYGVGAWAKAAFATA